MKKHEAQPVEKIPWICAICFGYIRGGSVGMNGGHRTTSKQQREANRAEVEELTAYRSLFTDNGVTR